MQLKSNIFFCLLLMSISGWSQLYLPLTSYYQHESQRLILSDSIEHTYFNSHQSLLPILDKRTSNEGIYASQGKHYYWLTQKLFKENFIVFSGKDYWCSIDPIVDLELGGDLSADSLQRLYWNTRGIRVQAKFFEKVGFTTSVYENQAILPQYQNDFADAHGEYFPNSINTQYIQNNAVIAGYARTKPFKTTGYDFAFAQGQVAYVPNKWVNFTIGNGNQFIGNGYRSLLLSDFSVNYPFGKIETNLWNGRIQYNAIYAIHQNLYRLPEYTTPEATYEKKIGTYHYLDIALTENIQIGFFEGNHWQYVDSLGSHQPDYLFINPVIFGNTLVKGTENTGFKSVLGLNASIAFGTNQLYGQLVMDRSKLGGYQIGFKAYNLIVPKLDLQVEYNRVFENTYQANEQRYNYGHYNLSLAHPYVNDFHELTAAITYQHNRFFIQNRLNYSQRFTTDSIYVGNAILDPLAIETNKRSTHILYNQFEVGYRFNKTYNLQAFIGHLYRNETAPTLNPLTNYMYLGVRTRLKNKYLDF